MVRDPLLECSFLIPLRRDADLSDGEPHEPEMWELLYDELFDRFQGVTFVPVPYVGAYEDPDTHERVSDESKKYIVAIIEASVDELRKLLSAACVFFQQKCIYLSVAGQVEFVRPPES
ncbi:MAG: hypothetical protein IH831_00060 [Planctomycetes bacterium]|nr:hypothetical protein [Planctomycetota bacterium]